MAAQQPSIGGRIKEFRRQRGLRTTKDLADAMPGSKITPAILENIESGRKADLNISQVLNIALALRVPPSYLLAPLTDPTAPLDLPNLSDDFSGTTAEEFDSWLAGIASSAYRSNDAQERSRIDQLDALRELNILRRESRRLRAVNELLAQSGDAELEKETPVTTSRLEAIDKDIRRLASYLRSADWEIDGTEKEWT